MARPLYRLSADGCISYDVAPVWEGDPIRTVREFACRIRSNTRMIICTMASNVFGILPPIPRLAALAHQHHLLFAVDAAQGAGHIPVLEKQGVDYLFVAGHKGLYGLPGVGILAIGENTPPFHSHCGKAEPGAYPVNWNSLTFYQTVWKAER